MDEGFESRPVDVVGVGLNATDTVIPVGEYPARGSKVEYRASSVLPGGQVATTVVACAQWGLKTRYVGKLGEDEAARLHQEAFARAGVETEIVTVVDGVSAQSVILVDAGGERTVLCRRDEHVMLRADDLRKEWIAGAKVLHVDGFETEAAIRAATWARELGVPVVADLDEAYAGIEELMRLVDYPIVSRDFPCRLMRDKDLKRALREMHERYRCRLSAATLGEGGVVAFDGTEYRATPAYKVPAVDTTGAGDVFHAGFIFGLVQGWELKEQMNFACAAAALNCMAVGARGGIRGRQEVEELMRRGARYEAGYQGKG